MFAFIDASIVPFTPQRAIRTTCCMWWKTRKQTNNKPKQTKPNQMKEKETHIQPLLFTANLWLTCTVRPLVLVATGNGSKWRWQRLARLHRWTLFYPITFFTLGGGRKAALITVSSSLSLHCKRNRCAVLHRRCVLGGYGAGQRNYFPRWTTPSEPNRLRCAPGNSEQDGSPEVLRTLISFLSSTTTPASR